MNDPKLELVARFFQLDPTEDKKVLAFLKDRLVTRTFAARELVTEAGRKERYFYIVEEGVQAMYLIDGAGDKVVLAFSFSGSPSGIYDSFMYETASLSFLEALKPSTLHGITRSDFIELMEYPVMLRWKARFFENILLGRLSREVELLTLSAKERYEAFVARCPPPLLTIPQKYLASYLNMTPETFSRLRSLRD
ncbi:MAG: Crp/Fnr family transcriptional regulator [Bacteroidota bacterium]